jgi:hypothetical protein
LFFLKLLLRHQGCCSVRRGEETVDNKQISIVQEKGMSETGSFPFLCVIVL